MQPKLLLFLIISTCLFSCKKSETPNNPVLTDTLSTGWSRVTSPASSTDLLQDIFFVNNIGFASTLDSTWKSSDGGDTWMRVADGGENIAMDHAGNVIITSISVFRVSHDNGGTFTNNLRGVYAGWDAFFAAENMPYYTSGDYFLKSIDGGDTWEINNAGIGLGDENAVFFIDASTGWSGTNRPTTSIFKTTDAGLTWQSQTMGTMRVMGISATSNLVCYASGDSGLIKTTDGGNTWQKIYSKVSAEGSYWTDVHFISASVGYLSFHNNILKTIDGGVTWEKVVVINTIPDFFFTEIHFTDANHGWACGNNGVILKFVQ